MERAVFERMEAIDATHWWFGGRRAIVEALLGRFAPKGPRRLLEVGCGTGSNLEMLSRWGRVDAIEPDDAARAIASARSGVAVTGGFLPDSVRIADAAFDIILLLDVLEHVADDRGALALLREKLAPGGRLLLTVPSSPWMWSAHDVAHHHHRRYRASDLKALLKVAGFRVVHASHFNTLLYPVIAAARLLGRFTGRAGGDDALPPPALNRLLSKLFGAEAAWVPHVRMPVGVSLAVVAERL
jgi:SAM-dependent methyltransferase